MRRPHDPRAVERENRVLARLPCGSLCVAGFIEPGLLALTKSQSIPEGILCWDVRNSIPDSLI